jgi:LasA protease
MFARRTHAPHRIRLGATGLVPVAGLALLASLAGLALAAGKVPTTAALPADFDRGGVESAVYARLDASKGGWLKDEICMDVVQADASGTWAFGTVAIPSARVAQPLNDEDARLQDVLPEGHLWVARREGKSWTVALSETAEFRQLLRRAPVDLLGRDSQQLLTAEPDAALGNTAGNLSLPWNPNESWALRGGPHGWTGTPRPWSSLDFNGGSGQVVAARKGVAFRMCSTGGGWIRVDHGDGWTTDYYHLSSMAVANNTSVTRRQYLGNQGVNIDCGGSASGPHVHFTIRFNGAYQEWNGRAIGGWTLSEGAAAYQGKAVRGHVGGSTTATALTGQTLYNAGIQYQANVEGIGWQGAQANWAGDGAGGAMAGTTGQNRRLEAINISLQRPAGTPANFDVCYEAHVQNIGWQGQRCNAQTAGTVGQGLRMEAIKIYLANPPEGAGVCYRAHVQNIGWQPEVCNGQVAGTTGQSLRIEALQIRLTP